MASHRRLERVGHRVWDVQAWDRACARKFEPTWVVNFAFVTRERESQPGYQQVNRELTSHLMWAMSLASVRKAITISSGAAVTEPESPYGALKLREEGEFLSEAYLGQTAVIGRAYALSGPFVRRPHAYAFSDFIVQAQSGAISILANQPVFRRYVSAHDFLQVLILEAMAGGTRIVESGGPLVEMQELAAVIRDVVNPDATIHRPTLVSDEPLMYASDGISWEAVCARHGYTPLDLRQQVVDASLGLVDVKET